MNDAQENLCQAIEGTGASLVKGLYTQIKDAIVWYVDAGITALLAAANTWTDNQIFQKGINVTQSTLNGTAVTGTGNGVGPGVRGTGGASGGPGVLGIAGGNGAGVIADSGTGSGEGIIGDASGGSGNALRGIGNSSRSPLLIDPQAAPTIRQYGAAYCDTSGRWFAATPDAWYPIGSGTADGQANSVGNAAGVESDLHSHTIPANRLQATPYVRVEAAGEIIQSGNAKTLRAYFGGNLIFAWGLPVNVARLWNIAIQIFRTGTNQQRVVMRGFLIDAAVGEDVHEAYSAKVDLAVTETAAIIIKTTGQDAAVADQIIEHTFVVEYP